MKVLTFPEIRRPRKISRRKRALMAKLEADERQADAILKAITGNQILPSRRELKQMINAGKWEQIGLLFQFDPVFIDDGAVDWRCVPKRVYELLQCKEFGEIKTANLPKRTAAERKLLSPKHQERFGVRELLYCQQNGECHYCGKHTIFGRWTIDHKMPLARGGHNNQTNRVGSCATCNHAKGPLSYDEFMATDYMGGEIVLKQSVKDVSYFLSGNGKTS